MPPKIQNLCLNSLYVIYVEGVEDLSETSIPWVGYLLQMSK